MNEENKAVVDGVLIDNFLIFGPEDNTELRSRAAHVFAQAGHAFDTITRDLPLAQRARNEYEAGVR